MKPLPAGRATIVDLLNRALDKGLVLNLDLIICVADIPLLGVNLKAALAGMETMLEYGLMADWDEAQRARARERLKADSSTRLNREKSLQPVKTELPPGLKDQIWENILNKENEKWVKVSGI